MPQQAGDSGDADDEENGPDGKQKPEKAQEQFHRGTNLICVKGVEPDSSMAPPRPAGRFATIASENKHFPQPLGGV